MPGMPNPYAMAANVVGQVGLEALKANQKTPEYQAPELSAEGQQTYTNLANEAKQSPGDIAAGHIQGGDQAFNSVNKNTANVAGRQNTALGMADPNNISSAINARMQRNLQGQMSQFHTQQQNQAQLESAQRLQQTAHLGLQYDKIQNSISQAKIQSEEFKIGARQAIINDIFTGIGSMAGGAGGGGKGGGKGGGGGGGDSGGGSMPSASDLKMPEMGGG